MAGTNCLPVCHSRPPKALTSGPTRYTLFSDRFTRWDDCRAFQGLFISTSTESARYALIWKYFRLLGNPAASGLRFDGRRRRTGKMYKFYICMQMTLSTSVFMIWLRCQRPWLWFCFWSWSWLPQIAKWNWPRNMAKTMMTKERN